MKTLIIVIAVVALTSCGIPQQSPLFNSEGKSFIVNGTIPPVDQIDAVTLSTVAIAHINEWRSGVSFCTGTIIEPRLILTAAHCVRNQRPGNVLVILTRNLKDSNSEKHVIKVEKIITHKEFRSFEGGNDIALIKLREDISSPYRPAPMYQDEFDPGDMLTIAGFGVEVFRDNPSNQGVLRQADVPYIEGRNSNQIVLGGNGSDTCRGDSGGPAYFKVDGEMHVAGITSYGRGCGDRGYYTKVNVFLDWIEENK